MDAKILHLFITLDIFLVKKICSIYHGVVSKLINDIDINTNEIEMQIIKVERLKLTATKSMKRTMFLFYCIPSWATFLFLTHKNKCLLLLLLLLLLL
jgi:hypothetical protein